MVVIEDSYQTIPLLGMAFVKINKLTKSQWIIIRLLLQLERHNQLTIRRTLLYEVREIMDVRVYRGLFGAVIQKVLSSNVVLYL